MPNISARPHATGERHTRPAAGGLGQLRRFVAAVDGAVVRLRQRLRLARMAEAFHPQHRDPRQRRGGGDQRPRAERHAPARALRQRHRQQRRQDRAQLQHGDVERADRADAIGEVALHQRRQHDVAHAHARQRHRRGHQQRPRCRRRRRARAVPMVASTIASSAVRSRPMRWAMPGVATPKNGERGGRHHAEHAGHGRAEAQCLARGCRAAASAR